MSLGVGRFDGSEPFRFRVTLKGVGDAKRAPVAIAIVARTRTAARIARARVWPVCWKICGIMVWGSCAGFGLSGSRKRGFSRLDRAPEGGALFSRQLPSLPPASGSL